MSLSTLTDNRTLDARIAFVGKTYGALALCIMAGTLGAYLSLGLSFPYEHPWLMLGLLVGGIMLVQSVRHVRGINMLALLGFGALTGMAIAPLVAVVAARSEMLVVQAFLSAGVVFVALSAYTFITRKDFSFLQGFVWTGLVGVLVLGLSNYFFFESSTLQLTLAGISVLLFSAFILYDTSAVLRTYPNDEYIAAALTLYLDVFLLFENLLTLFGVMGDD
ncbi:MAG: Bax inhibitor-1/YccA family protein [Zetaproteobacteria bacterium]|nr:MAG: Bax inhibitor-1/YccA family protein [Zetaproteobacteria bacterium]